MGKTKVLLLTGVAFCSVLLGWAAASVSKTKDRKEGQRMEMDEGPRVELTGKLQYFPGLSYPIGDGLGPDVFDGTPNEYGLFINDNGSSGKVNFKVYYLESDPTDPAPSKLCKQLEKLHGKTVVVTGILRGDTVTIKEIHAP
jgi:hypothetical protein